MKNTVVNTANAPVYPDAEVEPAPPDGEVEPTGTLIDMG
jgi:hypothetical protein